MNGTKYIRFGENNYSHKGFGGLKLLSRSSLFFLYFAFGHILFFTLNYCLFSPFTCDLLCCKTLSGLVSEWCCINIVAL